jgi:hypothetical protein
MRSIRSSLYTALALSVVSGTLACSDEPVTPPTTSARSLSASRAGWTVATVPADAITDNQPSIELGRRVPAFAGMYFDDDGQLVVAMTDGGMRVEAENLIRSRLGVHQTAKGVVNRSTVRFGVRVVKYTFMDLARYRTVLRDYVFGIPNVVSLDVKESENRVKIGISDAAAEGEIRKLLPSVGIPQDAVTFWRSPPGEDMSHTLSDTMANIQGGWRITGGGGCTLGFAARRSSTWEPVWVTNSHCSDTPHQLDNGDQVQKGRWIGREIADPPTFNLGLGPARHADVSLYSDSVSLPSVVLYFPLAFGTIARTLFPQGCDGCAGSLFLDHSNPTFAITGRRGYVIENETLNKVGATTGWTYGNVEDTCVDLGSSGWTKLCSDRVDFWNQDGDSGSPVFATDINGGAILVGILWGRIGIPYYDAMISNLAQIEKDVGALEVYDPGPPNVTISGATQVRTGEECRWDAVVTGGFWPLSDVTWSGVLSGTGGSIYGSVYSSGSLQATVTDRLGRTGGTTIGIEASSSFPHCPEA